MDVCAWIKTPKFHGISKFFVFFIYNMDIAEGKKCKMHKLIRNMEMMECMNNGKDRRGSN